MFSSVPFSRARSAAKTARWLASDSRGPEEISARSPVAMVYSPGLKSTETWVRGMNTAGVPCGPIYAIDQMFEDAQVQHLGMAQDVPNEEKRHIRLVGQPFTLSRTPSHMAARPPEFGEQTMEVLAEFGFGEGEISELRQQKVV